MLLLKRTPKRKPIRLLRPNIGHPTLENCLLWFSCLEGAGQRLTNLMRPGWFDGAPNSIVDFTWTLSDGKIAAKTQFLDDRYIRAFLLGENITADADPFSILVYFKLVDETSTAPRILAADYRYQDGDIYASFQGKHSIFDGVWRSLGAASLEPGNIVKFAYTVSGGTGTVAKNTIVNGVVDQSWSGSKRNINELRLGGGDEGASPSVTDIEIYDARIYKEKFSLDKVNWIFDNLWAPFERRIWVPAEAAPPGPVNLNIDDTRHARPVDQVDIIELVTIVPIDIDALRHGRRVDSFILGVSYDLFVAGLRHGRDVDAVTLEISVSLTIDPLRHGRRVEAVDVQALVGVVLDVSDQRHVRPVDSLLLDVDQPILVAGLSHGRPVDTVGVQPLLGDQTGIGATASEWILDAGQPLNNATSVDFDYHVLEGIFDSDQSVLGVDGARVTGPAGMRELTALTLGANVDGQERVQGEIAEIRVYAGALSQADRDRILQELTTKWITG